MVDRYNLEQAAIWSKVDTNGNLTVGGQVINFYTPGDEPHHGLLADLHPGTVWGGIIANTIGSELNLTGVTIAPFTDQELLQNAGIGTVPPTVPANVTATALSTSQITVNWSASSDPGSGVAGYYVYRGDLGTTPVTTTTLTTFANTGLTASTQYVYTVAAFDTAGNVSVPPRRRPWRPRCPRTRRRRRCRPT